MTDLTLTPQQKAALTRKKNKEAKETKETVPSFSIEKQKDGWYFVTSYLADKKIIKQNKVGPTMRAVVLDEFKMSAQRYFESMETF